MVGQWRSEKGWPDCATKPGLGDDVGMHSGLDICLKRVANGNLIEESGKDAAKTIQLMLVSREQGDAAMMETRMRTRRRWRYILLTLLSVVLLGVLATFMLSTLYRQYRTTQQELTGAQCILHLQDVAILVQGMRGLRLIQNHAQGDQIDASLHELSAQLLTEVGRLEPRVYPDLNCLRPEQVEQVRHYARSQLAPDRGASIDEATRLVSALHDLMQDAAYTSGLVLDLEPGSYFLANLLALRLPALIESVGRLRGQAAALVAADTWSKEDSRQMPSRMEGVRIALDQVEMELRAFTAVLPSMAKRLDDIRDEVRRNLTGFLGVTGRVERDKLAGGDALTLFDQGSQAIGSVRILHGLVQEELDRLLQARINALRGQITAAWLAMLGLLAAVLYLHTSFYRRERRLMERLELMATTDVLTGAGNRTRFEEDFTRYLMEADRYDRPLSIVMLDIDHFKRINDRYGHAVGDSVLRQVAKVVETQIRSADALYRWGGEEFCVLSPETMLEGARESAERIRIAVAGADFGAVAEVTVSLGVAQWQAGELADALLRRVDGAMYAAKQAGRNRVELAPPFDPD